MQICVTMKHVKWDNNEHSCQHLFPISFRLLSSLPKNLLKFQMKCFISMQRLNCLFACAVKIRQVHKNLRRTTLHTHTDTHSTPYATVANKCFWPVYLEAAPCIHINTITASKWNFTVENPKRNNNKQYSHWNTQNECRILFIHRFAVILIVKLTKYICTHEFFCIALLPEWTRVKCVAWNWNSSHVVCYMAAFICKSI